MVGDVSVSVRGAMWDTTIPHFFYGLPSIYQTLGHRKREGARFWERALDAFFFCCNKGIG